jgi:hypothetical protein
MKMWEYNNGEGAWIQFEENVQLQINDALVASLDKLSIGGDDDECMLDLAAGELACDSGDQREIRSTRTDTRSHAAAWRDRLDNMRLQHHGMA